MPIQNSALLLQGNVSGSGFFIALNVNINIEDLINNFPYINKGWHRIYCMIMSNNINTTSFFLFIECISDAGISATDCCLIYNANPWHRYYYLYFGNLKIDKEISKATKVA